MFFITLCIILSVLPESRQTSAAQSPAQRCGKVKAQASIPMLCVASNSSTVVLVPWSALRNRHGQTGEGWQNHYWYLTDDQQRTGWDTLVDDQNHKWRKLGTSVWAKHHQQVISMNKTKRGLILSVNLTSQPLKPKNYQGASGSTCWGFLWWAYSPTRTDPSFKFMICEVPAQANDTRPALNLAALDAGFYLVPSNPSTDDWFQVATGISGTSNNWLLLAEQAANATGESCIVCMGARPLLRIVPAPLIPDCVFDVMNNTNPSGNCKIWDQIFPVTQAVSKKPLFSATVAPGNFSCVNLTGTEQSIGTVSASWCNYTHTVLTKFTSTPRADIWWWCGDKKLFDRLPINTFGLCALVTLLLPITITPISTNELMRTEGSIWAADWSTRQKRAIKTWKPPNDPTYIDAIGVPRGVPDEYKIADQVAAGWESTICWWCTINKNVDRINYIHYNVQSLGNWTLKGFEAVHGQLSATSLMAYQNRIALDMLLAEKGGVCAIFGVQCCTFIPNNTAPDGSLTQAIEGLRTLNHKMKEHSGVDTSMWESWMNVFGRYKSLVASVLLSVAVFTAILTLCGCCCIPCIRSLINRLITTAIAPHSQDSTRMVPLLTDKSPDSDEEDVADRF